MKKDDDSAVETVARELSRAYDATVATPEGGWREVARAAIALGARPPGEDRRARLVELLGSDSTNFLGTGLTLREFMQLGNAEKMAASWPLQPREEQRRRLDAVVRLSAELSRLRDTTQFSTRLAEMAIEAVIEGNWEMVEEWVDYFAFGGEDVELREKYAPVFVVFRELLCQALRAKKEISA